MIDSHIRLLDMLAGWAFYSGQGGAECLEINELYQAAGGVVGMTDTDVTFFVINKVLPVLLKGETK